jgi:peptidyl-prolyl cis-trans isomerase D
MLENIREKSQGTIAKVILGLVILSFAIAGVGSYTNSVDTSVAHVNDEKISQQTFEQAFQAQKRRMEQQFGQMFETLAANPAYMANFRKGVLDNLINEKLLDQTAKELTIRVSDQRIKQTILNMPEFQVDGKFDNNRYLALINQAGFFQASDFRDYLKIEMMRRQLNQALIGTEFALPYQSKLLTQLQNQQRDLRLATITSNQFRDGISISDDEINAYYQQHSASFEIPEQVKVNYVTLTLDDVANTVDVTDKEVSDFYQQNILNYTTEEQRKLSHILIEFGDDKTAAKAKAEALLAKLKAGADFASLAKENSADTLSAEQGGDLDWVAKGQMDEAFENAAFGLAQVGDISAVVESSFGYHIIKLTDLKPEKVEPLAEVKDQVTAKLKQEKAKDKFFELQQRLSEVSFENPDNLEAAAEVINGSIQTSPWLTRQTAVAPFNVPNVINAAFSDEVLKDNVNSEVIEVNENQVLVMHLNDYQEAKTKPLAEVKEMIVAQLTTQKANQMAEEKAQALLDKLMQGEDISEELTRLNAEFKSYTGVKRNDTQLARTVVQQAFKLTHPVADKVSATTVTLTTGDVALLEVTAVKAGEATVDENILSQLTNQLAQSAYQQFVAALRATAEITQKAMATVTED